MRQEFEHSHHELPLEEVVRMAKEVTLQDGHHLPTVIADGSAHTAAVQLPGLADTHQERARQMFTTGVFLAHSQQVGALKQVFFVSEAWMSLPGEKESPAVLPSQDPKRREILAISRLKIPTHENTLVIFEMLRDETGQLTDLREFEPSARDDTHVESPLLRAFVAGFSAGRGTATN
jgi:hypothetical protein